MSKVHTVERIRELFSYDPATGKFYQKYSAKSGFVPGSEVGSINPNGYVYLSVDGLLVRAHRAAWAITHGEWPSVTVDHRNQNKSDNRLDNLRLATTSQNQANTVCRPNGTGRKGVSIHKGKYRAQIKLNGMNRALGAFTTLDEASHAYNRAAIELHGDFAVLNPIGTDKESP